jgi:hypothetical protein
MEASLHHSQTQQGIAKLHCSVGQKAMLHEILPGHMLS